MSKLFILLDFFNSFLHDEDQFSGIYASGANQFALAAKHAFVDMPGNFINFTAHQKDIQAAYVIEVGEVSRAACGCASSAGNTEFV
jgi:hypothetical protein